MEACIASPHWEACKTCLNNDSQYGCLIKEKIPLSLHLGDWILCDDYIRTIQLCSICNEPTGRGEDDSLYLNDGNEPICERCYYEAYEHLDV